MFALWAISGLVGYLYPDVHLWPMVFLLLIGVTMLGGSKWGLAFGAFATALSVVLGMQGPVRGLGWPLWLNTVIFAVAVVAAIALVEFVRARGVSARLAQSDLERAKEQIAQFERLHETQSALHEMRRRYAAIGDSLPYGTWLTNAEGTELLHVSDNYCRLFGMSRQEIAEGGFRSRVPPDDYDRFIAAWHARERDDIFENEYRVLGVDGVTHWILSRGIRLLDDEGKITGWAGFSLDITKRKRTEGKLALLSQLGRVLSSSLDPTKTLSRAADLVVGNLAELCIVNLVLDDGSIGTALVQHRDTKSTLQVERLIASGDAPGFEQRIADAIATGKSQVHQVAIDARSDGHAITLPLIAREQILGALTLVSTSRKVPYTQDDVDFAGIIARRVALAFDNARLYEREHRVASTLQSALLPMSLPDIPDISIRAHYIPGAKEAEIGGDWYDAFVLPDGRLGVSIGDVAGKGLQAASVMSSVRLSIRAAAFEHLPPSSVLERANQLLLNDRPSMVTAIFGIVDLENESFTYANAGHPLPIVASEERPPVRGRPLAHPLGILGESIFPEDVLPLPLGSLLVLYTDGLIEHNRTSSPDGETRLAQAVRESYARGDPDPAARIAGDLIDSAPKDDVAVLTISSPREQVRAIDLELPASPPSSRMFRQCLRRFCISVGMDEEKISLLQVALGEAVTNCIQHAYGMGGGTIRVRGRIERDEAVIDICDSGRWRSHRQGDGGYGLNIIRSIVKDVAIERSNKGTVVTLTQPIGRRDE